MKTFKLKMYVAVFAIFTTCITAQNNINQNISGEGNLMWKDTRSLPDAEGSPYLNEDFLPVKVSVTPDKVYTGRFNAYNGEMEVDLGNGKIIALDTSTDIQVTFIGTGATYKVYEYMDSENIRRRRFLLVVHSENSFDLLKDEKILYYGGKKAVTSFDRDIPPKFKRSSDDYYININGTVTHMPDKNKKLLKAFPKKEKALKTFLKKNKLNAKDENDLVKIGEFLAQN